MNVKRKIEDHQRALDRVRQFAERPKYIGSAYHKLVPGDFKLDPPSAARKTKTLCDDGDVFRFKQALRLLRDGFKKGMISKHSTGNSDWPKNIWAVSSGGVVFEAQGDNNGNYHGYPLLKNDPFREAVLEEWSRR
jgi:hypothetical protein